MSDLQNRPASNDEIDLVDLARTLWAKKLWIVLSSVIFTLLAAVYAFTAKEQWTSKAEVIPPRSTDLGEYLAIRKEYARILGGEFDANGLSNRLFTQFERLSYSLDEREYFLAQSELYKSLTAGENEATQRSTLSKLAREAIAISKPDPKKEPDVIGRKISFIAETPAFAQDTLKQFIEALNQAAFKLEKEDFLVLLHEQLTDLRFEKQLIERDAFIQKKVQLDNLSKAYATAEKAGIKEYTRILFDNTENTGQSAVVTSDAKVSLSESKLGDSTYLFMLGQKYLQAQIDVISAKDITHPPRYYQIQEQLNKLEPLLEKLNNVKVSSFSYLSSPDYPVARDKPKRALILLAGLILGGLFGCVVVLLHNVFKRKI